MTRSSYRTLLAMAAGALALATSLSASAQATITITGAGCTSWTLSGSPPAQTLTCNTGAGGGGAAPACTISGPTTGVTGTPIALTAKCVPEATSWTWDGDAVTNNNSCFRLHPGATCMASDAGIVTYRVKGTNAAGAGAWSPAFVVSWQAAPPPAPTGCSITPVPANGQLPASGGGISVTGSCSGGGTPTAWNWQKNGSAWGTTTAQQADTLPANILTTGVNYSYTLTACNGASCATPVSTTFTVVGTGGGGGGGISCPGYTKTIEIDVTWNGPLNYFTSTYPPGFTDDAAVVVKFTVPMGSPNSNQLGSIGSDEYGGPPTQRTRALSTQSCDWTSAGVLWKWEGSNGSQYFSVGSSFPPWPALTAGQTYYFNIKNSISGNPATCGFGHVCDIRIDWNKPPGT